MKRIAALFVGAAMLLGLAACSDIAPADASLSGSSAQASAPEESASEAPAEESTSSESSAEATPAPQEAEGGKTVIPFCTSSSSGLGESGTLLAEMAGTGDWLEGQRFSSAVSEADVQSWLDGLDLSSAPADGDTVASAVVTPDRQQVLYLWEEGNAPAETVYTENNGGYFDDPDFRPYITSFPVPEGTAVKGAVLICPGG